MLTFSFFLYKFLSLLVYCYIHSSFLSQRFATYFLNKLYKSISSLQCLTKNIYIFKHFFLFFSFFLIYLLFKISLKNCIQNTIIVNILKMFQGTKMKFLAVLSHHQWCACVQGQVDFHFTCLKKKKKWNKTGVMINSHTY